MFATWFACRFLLDQGEYFVEISFSLEQSVIN